MLQGYVGVFLEIWLVLEGYEKIVVVVKQFVMEPCFLFLNYIVKENQAAWGEFNVCNGL